MRYDRVVKLELTNEELKVFIELFQVDREWFMHTEDLDLMVKSIIHELAVKFAKKSLDQKRKQSFKLKMYEAVALRSYLLKMIPLMIDLNNGWAGPWELRVAQNKMFQLDQATV